jgi:hypothetical protein
MKINSQKLLNVLKKINMSGKHIINELIFDFTENGIQISVLSDDKTIKVDSAISKSAFENYKNIGQIGIQELSKLIGIIKTFGDTNLNLDVNDNVLTLKANNRKVELDLMDVQFINENINISIKTVQNFIADASINGEFNIIFETKEKELVLKNDGKFKFTDTIPIETAIGGTYVKFGTPFIDAVKNLEGDIQLSMTANHPCRILEKNNDFIISIIVAPKVEEE